MGISRELVLASASPRRMALLRQLDLTYRQETPLIDESVGGDESPARYVERLSASKAEEVMRRHGTAENPVILAADTAVVVDGNILGKPESKKHGLEMLQMLADREHEVLTGVTVKDREKRTTFHVVTKVIFRPLSEKECEEYWNTGEPCDKAGGYGIQGAGASFVVGIEGSYSNVVGLPLAEVARALVEFGIECDPVGTREEFEVVQDSRYG